MSAVNISKIKPGDKVTAEHTVVEVKNGRVYVSGSFYLDGTTIAPSQPVWVVNLISHMPAPREIKVGDTLPGSTLGLGCCKTYTVRGIDGGFVWFGGRLVVAMDVIRGMQAAGL